jgi:hypothetical protein
MACLAEKPIRVWLGSMAQVPVVWSSEVIVEVLIGVSFRDGRREVRLVVELSVV